jgi:nucleoside-triphosphatase THEP1
MADRQRASIETRRRDLLDLTALLTEALPVVGPGDIALATGLADAARRASAALAPIAVLGMEGAGKSTFVDALLGEVIPREEHEPGTIAPTVIRWGRGDTPTYAVLHVDSNDWTSCEDADQFRRFMLQRFNRDNVQSVAAGLIEMAHPALADGLILVDTPGLNTLSMNVRDISDAVLTDTKQAILVLRQRDAGPTFNAVRDRGLLATITAVVVNANLNIWLEEDTAIARHVDTARAATVDLGRRAGADITGDDVHVVHLPSLHEGRLPADALTDHPLHQREVKRLGSWLDSVVEHEISVTRLDEAARILLAAAGPVRKRLNLYIDGLRQLAAGKPNLGARASIDEWRSRKLARWDAHGRGDARRGSERVQWERLEPHVRKTREELSGAARRMDHLASNGASSSDVSGAQAACERAIGRATDAAKTAQEETALTVIADLRVAAQQLAMEPPTDVAMVLGPLESIEVRGNWVVDFDLPADCPADLLEVFSGPRAARRLARSYRDSAATIDRKSRTTFTACVDNAVTAFRQRLSDRAAEYATLLVNVDKAAVQESIRAHEEIANRLSQLAEESE